MSSVNDPSAPTSAAPEYEFIKLLGRGGMAEVYLAHKFAPGGGFKEVAFKRILPQFTSDPMRIAKFMDEITIASALVHPNVVGVHHWGEYDGDYFVELELIRGVTLMELIGAHASGASKGEEAYGPIAPVYVATIGVQMLQGLQYAHTFERTLADGRRLTGVVHRDISPDNVMVDLHGFAKINDWGISKALKGADRVASKTNTAQGKPYYHPPEQWRGDPVDARTDLYAVGTTLSLALCGRQLFASSPNETFEMIVYRVFQGDRPPIAEIAPPGSPPALVELLERLVQPDRDHRPRTAKELVPAFKQIVRELAGDFDVAREQLAAFVKQHYGGDSDTHKALQPPQFSTGDVPARSTRRPIDPATRPDKPATPAQHAPPERGALTAGGSRTAPLPSAGGTAPVGVHPGATNLPSGPQSAEYAAVSPQRPWLLLALAASTALLLALLAGIAGFVFGGLGGDDDSEAPSVAVEPPPAAPLDSPEDSTSPPASAQDEPVPPTPTTTPAERIEPVAEGATQTETDGSEPGTEGVPLEPGRLTITAIPHGPITLDGRRIAGRNQTRRTVSVPAGRHTVVAGTGAERTRCPINIAPGRHHTLEIDELERRCH